MPVMKAWLHPETSRTGFYNKDRRKKTTASSSEGEVNPAASKHAKSHRDTCPFNTLGVGTAKVKAGNTLLGIWTSNPRIQNLTVSVAKTPTKGSTALLS